MTANRATDTGALAHRRDSLAGTTVAVVDQSTVTTHRIDKGWADDLPSLHRDRNYALFVTLASYANNLVMGMEPANPEVQRLGYAKADEATASYKSFELVIRRDQEEAVEVRCQAWQRMGEGFCWRWGSVLAEICLPSRPLCEAPQTRQPPTRRLGSVHLTSLVQPDL
jgi:hypothetical protein